MSWNQAWSANVAEWMPNASPTSPTPSKSGLSETISISGFGAVKLSDVLAGSPSALDRAGTPLLPVPHWSSHTTPVEAPAVLDFRSSTYVSSMFWTTYASYSSFAAASTASLPEIRSTS